VNLYLRTTCTRYITCVCARVCAAYTSTRGTRVQDEPAAEDGIKAFVAALNTLSREWGCEQVSATHRTPSGQLVTLHVTTQTPVAAIEHEDGSLVVLSPELLP
jgi:hypothetical protein